MGLRQPLDGLEIIDFNARAVAESVT